MDSDAIFLPPWLGGLKSLPLNAQLAALQRDARLLNALAASHEASRLLIAVWAPDEAPQAAIERVAHDGTAHGGQLGPQLVRAPRVQLDVQLLALRLEHRGPGVPPLVAATRRPTQRDEPWHWAAEDRLRDAVLQAPHRAGALHPGAVDLPHQAPLQQLLEVARGRLAERQHHQARGLHVQPVAGHEAVRRLPAGRQRHQQHGHEPLAAVAHVRRAGHATGLLHHQEVTVTYPAGCHRGVPLGCRVDSQLPGRLHLALLQAPPLGRVQRQQRAAQALEEARLRRPVVDRASNRLTT